MAIYDGSMYNGLSEGFRNILKARVPMESMTMTDGKTIKRIWDKTDRPSYRAEIKENKKFMDYAQVEAAQKHSFLPPLRMRFLEEGPDMTIDDDTEFGRTIVIEKAWGQETVLDLKKRVEKEAGVPVHEQRYFLPPHLLMDDIRLGDLYVQWVGFGLDEWPPKIIVKPAVKGFEITVEIPATRDTAIWDLNKHKIKAFRRRNLIFDVQPSTKLKELKELIAKKVRIPVKRQSLSAHMAGPTFGYNLNGHKDFGSVVELDDDNRTMADYKIDTHCISIKFDVHRFDENGDFIFDDDPYFDDHGFHPAGVQSWTPMEYSTQWRPSADGATGNGRGPTQKQQADDDDDEDYYGLGNALG